MTVTSAFDSLDTTYLVLMNEQRQYSLWPDSVPVPTGWRVVHGPAQRGACLEYVEEHWIDMRPKTVVDASDFPRPLA